jgi:hypothetical protein
MGIFDNFLFPNGGNKHVTKSSSINKITPVEPNTFVAFLMEGCRHCKDLTEPDGKSILDLAILIIKRNKKTEHVKIERIYKPDNDNDIDKYNKIYSKFKIDGYPTLFFVDNDGTPHMFDGPRTPKDIAGFVEKHSQHVKKHSKHSSSHKSHRGTRGGSYTGTQKKHSQRKRQRKRKTQYRLKNR